MFLTTYVNAVDPLARVYDGFLVHSRFGPAAPLGDGSIFDELQSSTTQAVKFRPDLRVPLLTIITETDLFGAARHGYYLHARQPDNELLRVWEIPGAAHADNYTIQVAPIDSGSAPIEDLVAAYAPDQQPDGSGTRPLHQLRAAAPLRGAGRDRRAERVGTDRAQHHRWPTDRGAAKPIRPGRFSTRNGLARGGVRTPWVDVPIARTSGDGAAREQPHGDDLRLRRTVRRRDTASPLPRRRRRVPGALHHRARLRRSNPGSSWRQTATRS